MGPQADIVVTKPDSPEVLLVAEIKIGRTEIHRVENQIKTYMTSLSCPVGLLVTPEETRFYRNPFTAYDAETVELIGTCVTSELLGALPPAQLLTESHLEQLVERWLEGLRTTTPTTWPAAVQQAIESSVLPVVLEGVVRAAGPRWRRTGS